MIESPLTTAERERLQEAVALIRRAFGLLERFAEDYEKSHDIAELFQHRRIMKIVRSQNDTVERKVEKIAEIMRSFNFLCQLDDLRNETMYLSEHFTEFMKSDVFRPSEMKRIRSEFYETLSDLLIADTELNEAEPE